MTAPKLASYRHAYLSEIFDRLEAGDLSIKAKAQKLIALWKRQAGLNPKLWQAWENLLEKPVADMRAIVLAETQDGEVLRHSMPFAGVLKNCERTQLRRQYPGLTH